MIASLSTHSEPRDEGAGCSAASRSTEPEPSAAGAWVDAPEVLGDADAPDPMFSPLWDRSPCVLAILGFFGLTTAALGLAVLAVFAWAAWGIVCLGASAIALAGAMLLPVLDRDNHPPLFGPSGAVL